MTKDQVILVLIRARNAPGQLELRLGDYKGMESVAVMRKRWEAEDLAISIAIELVRNTCSDNPVFED